MGCQLAAPAITPAVEQYDVGTFTARLKHRGHKQRKYILVFTCIFQSFIMFVRKVHSDSSFKMKKKLIIPLKESKSHFVDIKGLQYNALKILKDIFRVKDCFYQLIDDGQ